MFGSAWSCDRQRPPPPLSAGTAPAVFDLSPSGARVARLLDHLDQVQLELHAPPLTDPSRGDIPLDQGWRPAAPRGVWRHPSPLHLSQVRYRAAPRGLSLSIDGVVTPFTPGVSIGSADGWEVSQSELFLRSAQDPASLPAPPVLHAPPIQADEERLDLALSGMAPVDFVHISIAADDLTRDALLLPAPAQASWKVDTRQGDTLRFAYTLVVPGERIDADADATARLSVTQDGAELWSATARARAAWTEVSLTLPSQGAGPIIFHSEPQGDPSGDYCVFANPELVRASPTASPARVVLVGIDTLRPDHLGVHGYERQTSPGLDAIAAESVVFEQARSPAPRTRPAFRTVLTGRWPLSAIGAPTLAAMLHERGFATAGIVANVHLAPRLGFAAGSDWWDYHESGDAGPQVDRALAWLQAHEDEDSFLFLHLMDPHVFYLAPEPYTDRFTGGLDQGDIPDRYNRWLVERWAEQGRLSPQAREFMVARYDGEIAYVDAELRRLVGALDALPGRTLLVVLSDHGEEFWDHGGYEHNHTVYDELVHTMLWIRPPGGWAGGPYRVQAPASLADVVPTILDLVGPDPSPRPPLDGVSLVGFLDPDGAPPDLSARPLQLGYMMFGRERWGVFRGHEKYILHTATGQEELYDLSTDPLEQQDLHGRSAEALPDWRRALAQATGFPVGPGWRIEVSTGQRPFTLRLQSPARDAGVINPEAQLTRRANLEWGETPARLPADVASVSLSEDRLSIEVIPHDNGIIYVLGPTLDQPVQVEADGLPPYTLRAGGQPIAGATVRARHGSVIVPSDTEARHLASIADPEAIEALRAMGYVQ